MNTKEIVLTITEMTCAACSSRIERVLNKVEGILHVHVNLTTEQATIQYDPNILSLSLIIEKIKGLGFGVNTTKNIFQVQGMTATSCGTRIEKVLNQTMGVYQFEVNETLEQVSITYIPNLISEQALVEQIELLGFRVLSDNKNNPPHPTKMNAQEKLKIRLWRSEERRVGKER